MEAALTVKSKPQSHNDGTVLGLLLVPSLIVAGLLFVSGAKEMALGVAATGGLISTLIAPEIGLYIYFMTLPFDQMWLETKGEWLTPGKIIGPVVLLICALHMRREQRPVRESGSIVAVMLAFGLWGFVTACWAVVPLLAIKVAGQVVVQVLLIVAAANRLNDRVRLGRALLFAFLAAVLASFLMMTGRAGSTQWARATMGEFFDPNAVALSLLTALFALPAAWKSVRSRLLRLGVLIAAPLVVVATVMTGSRMGLVMMVGVPVIGMLLAGQAKALYRLLVPGMVLALVLVGFWYTMHGAGVSEYTRERYDEMLSGRLNVKGEGRIVILVTALTNYLHEPLGYGYGNTAAGLGLQTGLAATVHDNVFSLLIEGGPVAFALILSGYWLLYRCVRRVRAPDLQLPAAMMFGVVVLSSCLLQTYQSKYFWVPITLCLLLVEQSRREELGRVAGGAARPDSSARADLLGQLGSGDPVICAMAPVPKT